jgi:hypothetical protein
MRSGCRLNNFYKMEKAKQWLKAHGQILEEEV